jgi:hypothetical protein
LLPLARGVLGRVALALCRLLGKPLVRAIVLCALYGAQAAVFPLSNLLHLWL